MKKEKFRFENAHEILVSATESAGLGKKVLKYQRELGLSFIQVLLALALTTQEDWRHMRLRAALAHYPAPL